MFIDCTDHRPYLPSNLLLLGSLGRVIGPPHDRESPGVSEEPVADYVNDAFSERFKRPETRQDLDDAFPHNLNF